MYLHLGSDGVVRESDIIGIFDIENTSVSKITKEFLNTVGENAEIVDLCLDIPKSFIVAKNGNKTKLFISQVSVATLKKRSENLRGL